VWCSQIQVPVLKTPGFGRADGSARESDEKAAFFPVFLIVPRVAIQPMSGRPLDVLEASLEDPVTVHLKDGTTYYGVLAGYDQHMNVVIEPEADVDDRVDDDLDGEFAVAIEDTTIIRGDNVVTIKA